MSLPPDVKFRLWDKVTAPAAVIPAGAFSCRLYEQVSGDLKEKGKPLYDRDQHPGYRKSA